MTLSERELLILKRYPEKPRPKHKPAYEYKVSPDNPDIVIPDLDVLFVLEEALDQLDNGTALREATIWLNTKVPDNKHLTHMGLKKIRLRLRPNFKQLVPTRRKITTRIPDPERLAQKLEKKRKQQISNDKKTIAAAQKRIARANGELINIKENTKKRDSSVFEVPFEHEIIQNSDFLEEFPQEEVIFKPNPKQFLFLESSEQEVLYGGAAGGGKSYALLADAARYFGMKSFNGVIIRRTLPELTELIWESHELYKPLVKAMTGKEPKWNEKDKMWTFPAGGHMWFSYCESEKDILNYQGKAFTWIGFDELTQHPTPAAWEYLRSRLRSTDPEMKEYLCMRAATNPGGPGHGWVKKMFIDPAPAGEAFPAEDLDGKIMLVKEGDIKYPPERWNTPIFYRKFIPAKLTDNPYLGTEYYSNLMSLPEAQRRQLLEGDWNSPEGAAFYEFRRSTHTCPKFEIPHGWRKFRSCDFGYSQKSATAVHWFTVDPDETLYVYRELYVKGMTARTLARKILEIESGENISYGVLDTNCWSQKGASGPTIAEEMIQEGCRWKPADKGAGSRVQGKNRLHELLMVDPVNNKPGIIFFDNCRNIISNLEVIPVDPDGSDDIDLKYADDHSYDSIRYGIMSRPRQTSLWETMNTGVYKANYRPVDKVFGY